MEEEKVTNEASFIDDLGADSLDTVEMVMALEETHAGSSAHVPEGAVDQELTKKMQCRGLPGNCELS